MAKKSFSFKQEQLGYQHHAQHGGGDGDGLRSFKLLCWREFLLRGRPSYF